MIGAKPAGYRKAWRACTCHPDDNPPVPCARRYALADCLAAARSQDGTTDRLPSPREAK